MNVFPVMFQSPEKIQKLMQRSYYMDFEQAKEFGLVDKVYHII